MHIYQEFLPYAHSMNESLQQRFSPLTISNNKCRITEDCLTRTQVFRSSRNYPLLWNHQVYRRNINTYLLDSNLIHSNESCTFTSHVLMINTKLMHMCPQRFFLFSYLEHTLRQWFPNCDPQIPGDPWIRFCNGYCEFYLSF